MEWTLLFVAAVHFGGNKIPSLLVQKPCISPVLCSRIDIMETRGIRTQRGYTLSLVRESIPRALGCSGVASASMMMHQRRADRISFASDAGFVDWDGKKA
jgi:hypothetical protein